MPKMILGNGGKQFDGDTDRPLQQRGTEFGEEQWRCRTPPGTASSIAIRESDHRPVNRARAPYSSVTGFNLARHEGEPEVAERRQAPRINDIATRPRSNTRASPRQRAGAEKFSRKSTALRRASDR